MPGPEAAVPEVDLDDILALGADPIDEIDEGESLVDSEEVAAPEETDGEGDLEPEADESSEEDSGEEAEEAEYDEGEEEVEAPAVRGSDRIRALAVEAKRAGRFRPILDILEEDPSLAREIVGRKLGLVPAERQAPAPAQQPQQPQRVWTEQEKDAYWNKKLQESPAGALAEMLDIKLRGLREENARAVEPANVASFKSVVRSFKADLQSGANADAQFQYYEPYFDALLQNADRQYVMTDPDTTLTALRDLAYGKWAREQIARAGKARRTNPSVGRDNPRRGALTPSSSGPGVPSRRQARPSRRLSDEERVLAERYGYDLVSPDEDETESAWR